MSKLALRYLGDFQVLRDGQELNLPPSRKTRALLAYLSLNPRKFRREFLCELLWEVPDDPRGSLRWSLSKLRRLIDDDDRQRIVADRSHVEIDVSDAEIDVATLFELAGSGLAEAPTEALEQAAGRYRANFLEGLDLPNFHDFHSWCIAERERVAHAQAALLRELVTRLGGEPGRALPYARALVALSPYDEAVRADLIRLLVSLGHAEEAEQHFELGRRMLQEIGLAPEGLMAAARRPTSAGPKAGPGAAERPAGMPEKGIGLGSGLIGREPEAAELLRLLQQVREQRQARFALVRGEPGIGKTRLIETVTALARGAGETILGGSAYESESIRPFALWVDALHRRDAAAATEIFGDRDAGNRDRLFDRLSDYVAAAAADDPLLLVFDDLHWCDDSSAAAIHYVARMCRERPILGILSARDSELRDNVPAQQA
ncbi:MAG: AAA family ATPase, partial [Gammaproteobacteria bacterium]